MCNFCLLFCVCGRQQKAAGNPCIFLGPLALILFLDYLFHKLFLTALTPEWRLVTGYRSGPPARNVTDKRREVLMKGTRRSFLKGVGAGVLCLSLGHMGFSLKAAHAYARSLKIEGAKEVISVCPFCAVCCQVIGYVKDGKLVSTEGDPDFPVNEGSLCAKGASLCSMYTHTHGRVLKPMYRAPYSNKWEEKDWDWMLDHIAKHIKEARDKDLILKNGAGQTVNRLETLFWMGTSHASNEECALIHEAMKGLGIASMDHQARV